MSVPDLPEGALLDAARDAAPVGIATLAPPGGLLIVAPHPDDETLGCGMALAAAAEAGRRIAILLLTDGEASHPASRLFPEDARRALRRRELSRALAALAPGHRVRLWAAHCPDGEGARAAEDKELIATALGAARGHGTRAVWSTWGGDPHCDHEAAARLAARLAEQLGAAHWSFPVWGRFGARPVPRHIRRFSKRRFAPAKRAAMAAYASQMTDLIDDDPDGFLMPSALAAHFQTHPEIFIHERARQ
ncbi:PIG-L family deacetylase [Erythrobacter sp.]|uniref:PIG-L deacetylase family protein n=1 Tax=Erythrobacter sp. TaxID=1042 RepID=UPI001425BBEF|nr:PIG-L family deacetylase [Erythrobacter sp.]QIQ85370.1 MAG: PIG-L family deacetylase [Erythrobacter sp.]